MTDRDLTADIAIALAELGDTEDAVAQTLIAAGCTGGRDRACDCPVYRWLRSRGLPVGCVCLDAVLLDVDVDVEEVPLPPAVLGIITVFDGGGWPELVDIQAVPS